MIRNIAFVTDAAHNNYAEDDRLLVQFLQNKNYRITPTVWDDPTIDWPSNDCIIVRSPWDYFLKLEAFTNWLNQLDVLKVRVFNPIPVLQWNKDKNYLVRFRDLGVPIPEFQYCEKGSSVVADNIFRKNQWQKAVIKPSVSGGAYKTWVMDLETAASHQSEFDELVQHQGVIIQKFSEEISSSGELSLIYFNKKFSHAVCKNARAGEFRVQAQYGGKHTPYVPDHGLLIQIEKILALIPESLLYARIDGYLDKHGVFYLMELELLEPVLFFDSDPDACIRFYHALNELVL